MQFNNIISTLTSGYLMYKYDLILGEDWIYHHSPIGLNLKTRQLSITVNGNETITFLDDKLSDHHQIIGAPKMCKLIKRKAITEFIMLRTHQTRRPKNNNMFPLRYSIYWINIVIFFRSHNTCLQSEAL